MRKTWGKTFNRWLWRLFFFTIYCFVLYQLWLFSHILHWNTNNPTSSAFMAHQLSILRTQNPEATLSHNWIAYQNISYEMKRAIIVAEDGKFTQHEGFDYQSLQNAFASRETYQSNCVAWCALYLAIGPDRPGHPAILGCNQLF